MPNLLDEPKSIPGAYFARAFVTKRRVFKYLLNLGPHPQIGGFWIRTKAQSG